MDKTTMDGFQKTCFGKTIEADGQIVCGKASINLSSILTVLIQEAGRWCRSYASDLFIYWSSLQKQVEDGTIRSVDVEGGCSGNLQGLSVLLQGMKVDEAIQRLEGIRCGAKSTSCPDQMAQALKTLI